MSLKELLKVRKRLKGATAQRCKGKEGKKIKDR
jgi:hypothetical protein